MSGVTGAARMWASIMGKVPFGSHAHGDDARPRQGHIACGWRAPGKLKPQLSDSPSRPPIGLDDFVSWYPLCRGLLQTLHFRLRVINAAHRVCPTAPRISRAEIIPEREFKNVRACLGAGRVRKHLTVIDVARITGKTEAVTCRRYWYTRPTNDSSR